MNNLAKVSAVTFGIQAFITLFVIVDPFAALPVFLSLVGKRTRKERVKLAWQGSFSSLLIIVLFAIFGQIILASLHINLFSLQGAGGFLLFLMSMDLLRGKSVGGDQEVEGANIAMVPIGTPVLAGPGGIVTTMLYVKYAHTVGDKVALAVAIVALHIIIGLVLMFSSAIIDLIKESGVELVTRVAGLLIAAVAFSMMIAAIKGFFNL